MVPLPGAPGGARHVQPAPALVLALAALVLVAALLAAPAGAAQRVVGGERIGIEQAPWVVAVDTGDASCTGTILDATHVVTAAHCTFAAGGRPVAPGAFTVAAGTSTAFPYDDAAQRRAVRGLRRHPRYAQDPAGRTTPDDVAVLELAAPLDLRGPRARAVALAPAGAAPAGAAGTLAGFGVEQEGATSVDGDLHALTTTIGDDGACAEDPGVQACASSPSGSPCNGDSGAGLVVGGQLAAVVAGGERCLPGSPTELGDLTAGELAAFVLGSDAPPEAPRGPAAGTGALRGSARVGATLACDPGTWTGAPTFAFAFVDAATGVVLQAGEANVRLLAASDLGRSVVCRVTATSAGGVASAQTRGTAPVLPAVLPPAMPMVPAPSAAAPAPRVARLVLVAPRRARAGATVRVRVVLRAGDRALGRTRLCLRVARGRLLRPGRDVRRACSTTTAVAAGGRRTFALRLRLPARRGAVALAATATGGSTRTARATVRVRA